MSGTPAHAMQQGTETDYGALLIKAASWIAALCGVIYGAPKIIAAVWNGLDVLRQLGSIRETLTDIQKHLSAQDEEQLLVKKSVARAEHDVEVKFARLVLHWHRNTLQGSALLADCDRIAGDAHRKDQEEADRRGVTIDDLHIERAKEIERLAEEDVDGQPAREAAVAKFKADNPLRRSGDRFTK